MIVPEVFHYTVIPTHINTLRTQYILDPHLSIAWENYEELVQEELNKKLFNQLCNSGMIKYYYEIDDSGEKIKCAELKVAGENKDDKEVFKSTERVGEK